jgi:signal transduction histidine kinase
MRLRTRFGLALGAVLIAATILPVALLYLLGVSGLVEAAYVAGEPDARQSDGGFPLGPLAAGTAFPGRAPTPGPEEGPAGVSNPVPPADGLTGGRFPSVAYDPQSGLWTPLIDSNLPRVVFTSPAFKFRVDLPAWLALISLPAIGLLGGIFLSVLLTRSVTRPVSRLAEAARTIGRRDLSVRVEESGDRELLDLAQSFNRMADELERAERTRRNLSADIAHELRTPLAVLDGNLRALLDGVRRPGGKETARLYEQVRHLNRLVGDLNELSLADARQLTLDRRETDLVRLAGETVAHFDLSAREQGTRLSLKADEPLVHPALDQNRIRQILHNLLANALRYTPEGGTVAVSVRRNADGKALEIDVADSGAGIAAEDLDRVFDRFYRAEESVGRDQGGTGLGLAIVKALVEAHGGTITAQSEGKGLGSVFSITLPI